MTPSRSLPERDARWAELNARLDAREYLIPADRREYARLRRFYRPNWLASA